LKAELEIPTLLTQVTIVCCILQVAIISQEESAMYVTYFDFDKLEFRPERGEKVYVFPRTHHCEVRGKRWFSSCGLKRSHIAYHGLKLSQNVF
jgi:hypothetical protein